MPKTLGLVLATLLAIAAIAYGCLLTQFGPTIISAIQTEGTLATQTQVLVGSVDFSLFSGVATIDGLTVGNPRGFSSPYAVAVARIALQVESSSLLGSGPIIVDNATVIAPQITYQAKSPTATSNLQTIKDTAAAYPPPRPPCRPVAACAK